jgi:UDP-glucose 4-epimerase
MTEAEQDTWGISKWQSADVSLDSLSRLVVEEGPPQIVFHSAGSASVAKSWENPLLDFERTVVTLAALIETLRRHAPKALLVYPSSAAVYGNVSTALIHEDSPLMPMSPYGVNKLIAEQLLLDAFRLYGLRPVIIRFFSLFGPGLRKQLLWDITQRLAAGPQAICLDGDGTEARDFMYAEDAARLVVHLAGQPAEKSIIVNGGNGMKITVADVANGLLEATGRRHRVRLQFSGAKRRGDPACLLADVTRLQETGFRPDFTFDAGVREFVKWAAAF